MTLTDINRQLNEVYHKIELLYRKGSNDEKLNNKLRSLLKARFEITGRWE